jgi:hypothetical protein
MDAVIKAMEREGEGEEIGYVGVAKKYGVDESTPQQKTPRQMHNMCRGCTDETKAQPQTRGGALQVHQYHNREGALTYKNDGGLICFANLQKEHESELSFTLPKASPGQGFTHMDYWNGPRLAQGRHRGFLQ